MIRAPQHPVLLVEWEARVPAFLSNIGPALERSRPRLDAECHSPGLTRRGAAGSMSVHLLILAVIGMISLRPDIQLKAETGRQLETAIYYRPAPALPEVEDVAGAAGGREGSAGRERKIERAQEIRIKRGDELVEQVSDIDAAHRELNEAAADMLAFSPAPPRPEVKSEIANALTMPVDIVKPAPAADVRRELKITQPVMEVVQPTPEVALQRTAPVIDIAPVAPAPNVETVSATRAPQLLAQAIVPPVPMVDAPRLPVPAAFATSFAPSVAAPAPQLAVSTRALPLSGTSVGKAAAPAVASGGSIAGARKPGSPQGSALVAGVQVSARPGTKIGAANRRAGSLIAGKGQRDGEGIGGSQTAKAARGTGAGLKGTGTGTGDSPGSGGLQAGIGNGMGVDPTGTGTRNEGEPFGISVQGMDGGAAGVGSGYSVSFDGARPMTTESLSGRGAPAITVVATAGSGGAFLGSDHFSSRKVYTIYMDTSAGTAVLQYGARGEKSGGAYDADLSPPELVRSGLPADMDRSRIVLACVIDRQGALRDLRIVEGSALPQAGKIVEALRGWVFRPVLQGGAAVEVDALLGFGVDTR